MTSTRSTNTWSITERQYLAVVEDYESRIANLKVGEQAALKRAYEAETAYQLQKTKLELLARVRNAAVSMRNGLLGNWSVYSQRACVAQFDEAVRQYDLWCRTYERNEDVG